MNGDEAFNPVIVFNNNELKEENKKVLNRIASALFVFFAPDEDGVDENELDELYKELGGVASVAMASAGMKLIGENIHGDYVVQFDPSVSFDSFAKNTVSN